MKRGDLYAAIRSGNIAALRRARKLAQGLQDANEWSDYDQSLIAMLEGAEEEATTLATELRELNQSISKAIADRRAAAGADDTGGC